MYGKATIWTWPSGLWMENTGGHKDQGFIHCCCEYFKLFWTKWPHLVVYTASHILYLHKRVQCFSLIHPFFCPGELGAAEEVWWSPSLSGTLPQEVQRGAWRELWPRYLQQQPVLPGETAPCSPLLHVRPIHSTECICTAIVLPWPPDNYLVPVVIV